MRRESQHFVELMADIDHGDRQPVSQRLQVRQDLLTTSGIERGDEVHADLARGLVVSDTLRPYV